MKCKICGKNADSEYCFQHKPRKPLKRSRMNIHSLSTKKVDNDEYIMQTELFKSMWDKNPHNSEISGQYLGEELLSIHFHHILPKEKYPDLKLIEENVILLSFDEHQDVENDMYKFEEINNRRNYLKTKYNII